MPTFTAFAVTDLLIKHFGHLVDVEFTKGMEDRLDQIAEGSDDWLGYLKEFYLGDDGLQQATAVGEKEIKPAEARQVNIEGLGATVRIGRFGPYVEKNGGDVEPLRASLPKDATPADLDAERIEALLRQRAEGPAVVGVHPESGEQIFLLDGQYGPYVQLGQQEEGSKVKPKRASLPKGAKPEDVTLEMAVGLLALPRLLGNHPESGRPVKAGLGRFGPYILHDLGKGEADFRSLKVGDEVLTVDLDRAVALLAEPKALRGRRAAATPLREIGVHPADGKPVQLFDGKYGPYVKHGVLNASLPRGADPKTFALDAAVLLIEEKGKAPKAKRGGARTRGRAAKS